MKLREITKKSLASIALVSLIYVHSAITIDGMLHGFISYAINDEEVEQQQNSEEQIPEKLEILRDDQFCKTDMRNVQYEYAETIKINVNSNAIPEKILATDSSNEFFNGDELSQEEIEVNYLKTTINREQLANFLGTNGRLEIKNPETETIYCNFDASELQTLSFEEEGEVIEEVTVKDQNDEDVTASNIRLYTDKIEIEYMLAVEKLQYMVVFERESTFEEDQYLALGLENTKQIDIIENLEDVNKMKTVIEYKELGTVAGEETVIDDKTVEKETTIEERKTVAELGINQPEIPVGVEREIQLTVTLHTESIMYDLWKNPEIQIEFPEYIEDIQDIDTSRVQIINNKVVENNEEETIFEISEITKENNSINISFLGEQEEYTEQLSNIQIIIPVTIKAKKLMPSVTENISLKYTNENVTTYDNSLENGLATSILQIQAVQGIITNSKVTVGNKTSESYRSDIATLTIPSKENQTATIENIVINNKQENLSNLKIKGSSEILGEIQVQGAQVYYSNQEEIGLNTEDWQEEYFEGANKYLIVIDDLQQGETIQFSYSSVIPEVEEDTTYIEEYTIYQGDNEEVADAEIHIAVQKAEEEQNTETQQNTENEQTDISATLYSRIFTDGDDDGKIEIGDTVQYSIEITNSVLENRNVSFTCQVPLSFDEETITVKTLSKQDEENEWSREEIETNIENNQVSMSLVLLGGEKKRIVISGMVYQFVESTETVNINIGYGTKSISLQEINQVKRPANIVAKSEIYKNDVKMASENIRLQKGDELKYIANFKNHGETVEYVNFTLDMNENLKITSIEYSSPERNGSINEENLINRFNMSDIRLGEEEEANIVIKMTLADEIEEYGTYINHIYLSGSSMEQIDISSIWMTENENTNPGEVEEDNNNGSNQQPAENEETGNAETSGEQEIDNNNGENTNVNDNEGSEEIARKYSISGLAWLDKDRNGIRDEGEELLKGIKVNLLTLNNIIYGQAITDLNGEYIFDDIEHGNYILSFEYDTTKYELTIFQETGAEGNLNSDVMLVTTERRKISRTDIITVDGKDITNIDIGLVLVKTYDVRIDKYVDEITIENNSGVSTIKFQNQQMAKIEIPGKDFIGSNLVIKYKIIVTNVGDVPAYIYNIEDSIPKNTNFSSEINKIWYQESDKIYCIEYSQEELKPQQAKEIYLVLTYKINSDKAITLSNEVNIKQSFNEELLPEKDLLNNSSKADVIISLKTGTGEKYILLWLTCIIIIGMGTFGIIRITRK